MYQHITSLKNPKIKNLIRFQKPRVRHDEGLFVIEGTKEIERAYDAGYRFVSLFWYPGMLSEEKMKNYASEQTGIIEISREIFEKVTYRGNTGGLLVVAEQKSHINPDKLNFKSEPLIVVLESVEKPGNLGAILRTADAAGVDAVIVCDQQTDIYNPNVIRSSIGCLFTVSVFQASSEYVISFLKSNGINIYCAALTASVPYHTINYKHGSAIVLGTEATGLTQKWLAASTQNIIIPMQGIADSLNVSTSAAITLFEAKRQRGFY